MMIEEVVVEEEEEEGLTRGKSPSFLAHKFLGGGKWWTRTIGHSMVKVISKSDPNADERLSSEWKVIVPKQIFPLF